MHNDYTFERTTNLTDGTDKITLDPCTQLS